MEIANVAKHSDLTAEQVEYIKKEITVVNSKEAFWGKFCQDDRTPKADKIKWRHQVLIDPAGTDILTEGVIPDPTKIKIESFSQTLVNVGSYMTYTEENLTSMDDMVNVYSNQLAHERLYDLEKLKSAAYLGTTNTVAKAAKWLDTLLLAKASIFKGKGKPVSNGHYVAIVSIEDANAIALEAGDAMKGSEGGAKAIADGYVGYYGGFDIYSCLDMYQTVEKTTKTVALFFGKNELGEFPVLARSFAGENAEVINNGINSGDKNDPLNQFGTIGSKICGVGAVLQSPEVVFKCVTDTTVVSAGNTAKADATETSRKG